MKLFFKHARDRICLRRSIRVALSAGTLPATINQSDAILGGMFGRTNVFQIVLTYLVPFCVSTFGSAIQARHIELQNRQDQ